MRTIIGNGKVANVIRKSGDTILSHSQVEIRDKASIENNLKNLREGSVVINTAAKISLEWCEENQEEAAAVNTYGAINLADVCKKYNLHLIHVSSGCIFDGMETEKIYTEDDIPTPAAWYTKTKTDADDALMSLGHNAVTIIRPRQLISAMPHKTNMLTKFVSLGGGKFLRSKNSITCIEDMSDMIDHLIKNRLYGIYNLANTDYVSPYQIAEKIKEKINADFQLQDISYEEYLASLSVKRVNTLLSVDKLISSGYTPRSAIEALNWCIDAYGKHTIV